MSTNQITIQLGKTVRKLRKSKDMTQEGLAEATDCNVDTISNIERGVTSARLETLIAISKVFDLDVGELFNVQTQHFSAEMLRLIELLENQSPETIKTVTEQAKVLLRHKS